MCSTPGIKSIATANIYSLNPIQDGLFRGYSRMGRGIFGPLPKIRHTNPTMMKFDTGNLIPYLRKIQKMYKQVTRSSYSADISIFSPEISKFCYVKKSTYRLDFDT